MIAASQWVSWIIATAVAAVTMVGYVHANFTTIREAEGIVHRLDRIEMKIDRLLQKK